MHECYENIASLEPEMCMGVKTRVTATYQSETISAHNVSVQRYLVSRAAGKHLLHGSWASEVALCWLVRHTCEPTIRFGTVPLKTASYQLTSKNPKPSVTREGAAPIKHWLTMPCCPVKGLVYSTHHGQAFQADVSMLTFS